jgi:vacuolar-type H+-ATPase subunit H
MGKKGVEDMIDEIEVFIGNCKYQPLSSNKIIVPKDELERMLSELKLKLPSEIERCKKIMRNKEAILASARTRSDAIISESVNEANRLVDSNHITELANIRADEIVTAARDQAQQILDDATAEAKEVRLGAMSYTKQKLSEMKNFLAATLEAENENYKNLCDSLESNLYTLDNNLGELDTSIDLINGNDMPMSSQPAMAPQPEYAPAPAAAYDDDDDEDYDDYDDEDEEDDDFDDDDYDDEDDDDDFLDE